MVSVTTSSVGGGTMLRHSSDDPSVLTMEVKLPRLVVVRPWLWQLDPDLPEVLGLSGGCVSDTAVWAPGCDDGLTPW
jgi:hypothetical protein